MDCILRHIALALALIFVGISANAAVQDYDVKQLPYFADLADGHITEYLYDASGRKLQTKYMVDNRSVFAASVTGETDEDELMVTADSTAVETLLTRDYVENYIYADSVFERVLTPTGDYTVGSGYRYYIKDYQGNTANCVPYSGTANWRYYYPYGFPIEADSKNDDIRHLYSGKELDRMHQLGWYDFHARTLDPLRGQFTSLDPLCEKYYGYSPYSFCAGNPVNFIDPTGMDWVSAQYENHQFYYFFSNINGMTDFNNTFGEQSNFSYLGKEYSLNINDSSFELLADGNISHNGNILDKEYDQNNILIGSDYIVSSVNNNGSPIQNRYGFYFGEKNPINKIDKTYSYSKPPIDELDYAAWRHDRAYDKVGAAGPTDALFNPNTALADGEFLLRSLYSTEGFSNKAFWARGASIMFYYSFMIKTHPFTRSILKAM